MALFGGPSQPVTRLEELKRLLQRDPTSRQFLALAEEYRRHGKYRDAVITLERGLALHQTSVAGHVALGKTYQQLDRLEDAIRAFTNALRIDRENLVAIRQLAEVYLAKGDKIEAIKKLKLYRGLKAGDRDVNDIIARLEGEMSAAVGERAGFRSGVRPAVEAPPPVRPPGLGSSSTLRRAALLRRIETRAPEPAPEPPPPGGAPPRSAGAHVRRRRDRARARERRSEPPGAATSAPSGCPAPARSDELLRRLNPSRPSGRRRRARSRPSRRRSPRSASPRRRRPPPFEVSPPEFDVDDVPTAPFEFPVDLYRVGSAPEPPPRLSGAAAAAAASAPVRARAASRCGRAALRHADARGALREAGLRGRRARDVPHARRDRGRRGAGPRPAGQGRGPARRAPRLAAPAPARAPLPEAPGGDRERPARR